MNDSGREFNIVWGAEEIARVIGRTPRQTFHLMASGQIPATSSLPQSGCFFIPVHHLRAKSLFIFLRGAAD